MTTISTSPALLAPNRAAAVRFRLTYAGASYVRAWCTSAPQGSEFAARMSESAAVRVLAYEGDGGDGAPWNAEFDKGGAYTFAVQEYAKGAAPYGGGYEGSPDSAPAELKIGPEQSIALFVGQRLTCQLGAGADTATLVLWVAGDSVVSTSFAAQGEASPVVTADNPTPRARLAMGAAGVSAAVAALPGSTSPAGDVSAIVPAVIAAIRAHMLSSAAHSAADSANPLPAALAADPGGQHLGDVVSAQLASLRRHMDNEATASASASGPGSANYHSTVDRANAPILNGSGGQAAAYAGLADLWRAYEAHRVSAVHSSPDSAHALSAPPPLLAVHIEFLRALATSNIATPPGQSSLATQLVQLAGCDES
jgi:hypothetical protein